MKSFVLSALSLIVLASCGGGELPKPRPVTSKLDEMYIARVPPDKRPEVTQAQNEFQLERSNRMTAEDDYKKSETDVRLAQADIDKASIEERSAQLKSHDAESSHDLTLKNAAASELRAAQLGRRAADARLAYQKARRDYLKMVLRFHEFEVINKEAKFELEKSKVAKSNNIQPDTGVTYDSFESQYRDRSTSAQRAKADAERLRSRMVDKEREWKASEKEWNTARGVNPPPEGEQPGTPPADAPPAGTP